MFQKLRVGRLLGCGLDGVEGWLFFAECLFLVRHLHFSELSSGVTLALGLSKEQESTMSPKDLWPEVPGAWARAPRSVVALLVRW